MILFPFADYCWVYAGFIVFVLAALTLDLGVFHKNAHEVEFKEASIWTAVWTAFAILFSYLLYFFAQYRFSTHVSYSTISGFHPESQARASAMEFLTSFFVEKSLAIDNVFVFTVVFAYFGIPKIYQHRILIWGILGALFFRGILIAMASVFMKYHWLILMFGAVLIVTGIKMFFTGTKQKDLENNFIIRQLRKFLRVHPQLDGQKLFIKKAGLIYVTPLFLALAFIELSDIIFAVDSIPAIFAITKEPLIVFTSNIFAILGLRSMYFMLAGIIDKFVYIKYGLASVLIFVGLKMVWLNEEFDGKFPVHWSLGIILLLVTASIITSIVFDRIKGKKVELKKAIS